MTFVFELTPVTAAILHVLVKLVFFGTGVVALMLLYIAITLGTVGASDTPWWCNGSRASTIWSTVGSIIRWTIIVTGVVTLCLGLLFLALTIYPALGQ